MIILYVFFCNLHVIHAAFCMDISYFSHSLYEGHLNYFSFFSLGQLLE